MVVLETRLGETVAVHQSIGFKLETLAESGLVDCVIADAEDGFSPLGQIRSFLASDLDLRDRDQLQHALDGFPARLEKSISSLAYWSRFESDEVTLIAIPSERHDSHLRGLILTPYDDSLCYKKYAHPKYRARPHRDFMYNVTYEAIAHAYTHWGARRIGLVHFARYGLHRDTTTCQIEAIVHFCNEHKGIESVTFLELQRSDVLEIAREFNQMKSIGVHRPIETKASRFSGIDFVDLDWTRPWKQTGAVLPTGHGKWED